MRKSLTLCFFIFSFATLLVAQNGATYSVQVNTENERITAHVLNREASFSPVEFLLYTWYSHNQILTTQGGFSGKILHGSYKNEYPNHNLKEQGEYRMGLKEGRWNSWYDNGALSEITHWRRGVKHGKFILFNELGERMIEANFRKGRLDGKMYSFEGDQVVSEKRYRNGDAVVKVKKSKKGREEIEKEEIKEKDDVPANGMQQ